MPTNLQKKKERQQKILFCLDNMGFASRSQIQRIFDLGSNRNASRVLKDMEEYLNVTRLEENIYYLNKKGRELIGSNNKMVKTQNIEHHIMRNDAYVYFGCPKKWMDEYNPVKDADFVPDSFFRKDNVWYFLEVDNLQKMSNNRDKFKRYKKLKDRNIIQPNLNYFPTLIWVTTTPDRQKKLQKLAEEYDVLSDVYIRKDLL